MRKAQREKDLQFFDPRKAFELASQEEIIVIEDAEIREYFLNRKVMKRSLQMLRDIVPSEGRDGRGGKGGGKPQPRQIRLRSSENLQ